MLKVLVKKQMAEIFRGYFYNSKKNKARSKSSTAAYIALFVLLMAGVLGGMFTFLALMLCAPMAAAGTDWLYFAMLGMLSVFLGVFGSVFNTYSCLYLAKDNDLLLSMPIPVNVLMASRLLTVYLMGLMYSGIVILPAIIVYWAVAGVSLGRVFGCLLLLLIISAFVLTLSCALGWAVAKISLKLKHKSFVTVAASLLFFGVYYFISFRAQTLVEELIHNAVEYGKIIKDSVYPVYLFGRVATGDILAMLIVSATVFALLGLMWALISRSFLRVVTSTGKTQRKIYRETAAKRKSPFSALFRKELRLFTSSPNYMLNCGFGIVFLPIAGVAFLWKGRAMLSVLNEILTDFPDTALVILCSVVCILSSLNDMTAPSVSLEGRSIWRLQSLPVTPWQVLKAKLSLQLLLTGVPMLFCIVCMAVARLFTPLQLFVAAVQMLSYVLLSALFGLFLGLKMPNLSWTNEITVIKQSAGVAVALFGGFIYSILLTVGFILPGVREPGFAVYMSCFSALTLALCAALFIWLKKRGCALFAQL